MALAVPPPLVQYGSHAQLSSGVFDARHLYRTVRRKRVASLGFDSVGWEGFACRLPASIPLSMLPVWSEP